VNYGLPPLRGRLIGASKAIKNMENLTIKRFRSFLHDFIIFRLNHYSTITIATAKG